MTAVDTTYPGHLVGGDVPLHVFLPPCYEALNRPTPALLLFHGKPFDQMHWDDVGLDEAAGAAIVAGEVPPVILVMPLLPEPLFSGTDGGPGSYEEEVLEGLLPAVGSMWAIERWSIGGISRGGVWALEIGLRNPAIFDSVGALSPSLAVNYPRAAYDPLVVASSAAFLPRWVFLGAGETDWARPKTEDLGEALGDVGNEADLQLVPGDHETATWQALLIPYLDFLASALNAGLSGDG